MTDAAPSARRLADLDRGGRLVVLAAVVGLAVTVGVLLHALQAGGFTPIGDEANEVRGALTAFSDRPLVGDFNTAGIYGNPPSHHPGPAAYYAEAPFVDVLGAQHGSWAFAILLNGAAIVGSAWLAFRAGGLRAGAIVYTCAVASGVLALAGSFASTFFQDLPLLPLMLCLVATWAAARGDTVALPVLAAVGTFVVQTELLYVPLLGACWAFAAVAVGLRFRGALRRGWPARHVAMAVALLLVLWAPVLDDQVRGSGNLSLLAEASVPSSGLAGIGTALSGVWFGLVCVAAGLLVATLVDRRSAIRRRDLLLSVGVVLAGTVATAALLPTDDPVDSHRLWLHVVSLFLVAAGAVLVADVLVFSERFRPVALGLAAVVVLLVPHRLASPAAATAQDRVAMRAVNHLVPQLTASLPPGTRLVIADRGGWASERVAQGLLPRLQEDGRPAVLSDRLAPGYVGLVVTRGRPTRWMTGRLLASYAPAHDPARRADAVERLDRWARSHGPLQLTADGRTHLLNLVDGLAPTVCLDELRAHPQELLDLAPDMAARLYALGWIQGSGLPADLRRQADLWQAGEPVRVWLLPAPEGAPDTVFSKRSCAGAHG